MLPLLRDRGPALTAFTADRAAALEGPGWLRARRAAAAERFASRPMPNAADDELWRYTPVADLDLDGYTVTAGGADGDVPPSFADAVVERAGLVRIVDGRLVSVDLRPEAAGVTVTVAGEGDEVAPLDPADPDALTALHDAFVPEIVVVRVPAGVVVERPIVITQTITSDGGAVFPHVVVETGESSEVTVLDCWAGDVRAFASPVVELHAGDNAQLRYVGVQVFGEQVWSTGYLRIHPGRDATANVWLAALGGDYARLYVDARLDAQGANTDIAAVYFGEDDQTHDFRSLQDHLGSRTASNFLLKGAVVDRAHGIYTGLIRVHEGAKGTESFLTNRNLVLNDGASVDSVPNLEIVNENDIKSCGHAAATGPVDAEHVFYLESRGVPTDVAERLIVFGFFDDVVSAMPVEGIREPLRREVARKLEKAGVDHG